MTLEHTIDEYIRLIGSIKLAFNSRAKTYQIYQTSASDLAKRKAAYEKLKVQPKTRQDKLVQAEQEIAEVCDLGIKIEWLPVANDGFM